MSNNLDQIRMWERLGRGTCERKGWAGESYHVEPSELGLQIQLISLQRKLPRQHPIDDEKKDNPDIDQGYRKYPSSLILKFGAGLLIVIISVVGAIISYYSGSRSGFVIATGVLSIGAFVVALALLEGQEIDVSGKQ